MEIDFPIAFTNRSSCADAITHMKDGRVDHLLHSTALSHTRTHGNLSHCIDNIDASVLGQRRWSPPTDESLSKL